MTSQHDRDSRELRELCAQRDAARATVRQQAERIAELEADRDQLRAEVSELRAALWHVKHVAKDVEAAKTIAGDAIDQARTTHKDEG